GGRVARAVGDFRETVGRVLIESSVKATIDEGEEPKRAVGNARIAGVQEAAPLAGTAGAWIGGAARHYQPVAGPPSATGRRGPGIIVVEILVRGRGAAQDLDRGLQRAQVSAFRPVGVQDHGNRLVQVVLLEVWQE